MSSLDSEKQERIQLMKNNTYSLAMKVLLVSLFTGVSGALVGHAADIYFDIKPVGTLIILGIFFLISWTIIFKFISDTKQIVKESKSKNKE